MENRRVKRNLIIVFYLALLAAFIFGVYTIFKPDATCNDGRRNQLEEGVDCGGPCAPCDENLEAQDLVMGAIEWVDTATDNFDTVISVKNPNSRLGASTVRFKLKYLDSSGQLLKETSWKKDFILPQQEKYFLVQEESVPENPAKIEVEIGEVIWKKFTSQEQNPRLEVILTEFTNSFRQDPSGLYRVTGTLVNESPVDLEVIKFKVILRDSQGKLLATNAQVINTVRSKEQRDFNIPFPSDYNLSNVSSVEIKPETNIFNSNNHVRFFGIVERESE